MTRKSASSISIHWWRREESKKSRFKYLDAEGNRLNDPSQMARIKSLVIPPAWINVRINPSESGRLQAIGFDKAGRKQYLYNSKFVARTQRLKFAKLERFGLALPQLRRIVRDHMSIHELSRERVLAIIVRLIDDLSFRIGTEKNVRRYQTYGVSTLRNRHLVSVDKHKLTFKFVGKHHITQNKTLADANMVRVVIEIRDLPGPLLFQYLDESGKPRHITPHDINRYIKDAMGEEFSARDFRVWAGTMAAAVGLAEFGPALDTGQQKKNIVCVCKTVARALGNTPAVCRSAYIHPIVIQQYTNGITIADYQIGSQDVTSESRLVYKPHERELLKLFSELVRH